MRGVQSKAQQVEKEQGIVTFLSRAASAARRYPLPFLAMAGLAAGLIASFGFAASDVSRLIFLMTLVVGGLPVVAGTVRGMLHGKFAADVVATLAILGAALTNEYLAGCVIVLMQTGGEALEDYAVRRASASVEQLLARAPRIAHRRRETAVEDVPVAEIAIGDQLLVRPGEVIPVDAQVVAGGSAVDESALTGEPVPVSALPGDEVMSGSICVDGALEIRALRLSSESQYEQIVRLVQAAQADKPPLARLADRYAVVFTPVTLVMCALAFLISGQPTAVVAVLVVATPCPLILATPVAIISGINRAARHGIIVKGGTAIERIGQATAVVFDKTGTLTAGTPVVERIEALDGYQTETILRLSAGLEQLSSHPMARALVSAGHDRYAELPLPQDVVEAAGQGVSGQVEGHMVNVGSSSFAAEKGLATTDELARARAAASAEGASTAMVGIDGKVAGLVVYADRLRQPVPGMLARLQSLGVTETAMLTGDDALTAQAIAEEAGITTVRSDLLPSQKVDAVREVLERHRTVVMVGDGINDAPALATATVGIALGAHGAAVSAEAADIVITTDDVSRVASAVEIGQRTLHIAKQSIWVGLSLSASMMVLAALGLILPAQGAVLQEALDVAVILNALRAR